MERIKTKFSKDNGRLKTNLYKRARIIASIRSWFLAQGFLEVETPLLVNCHGMETHLFGFETSYKNIPGEKEAHKNLMLPSSPEFHMKKLLVAGFPKIFQISKCFRNGEHSDLHEPEFTMLEWYRAGESYEVLARDLEGIVQKSAAALQLSNTSFAAPFDRITVKEAFKKYTGFDFPGIENPGQLQGILKELGLCVKTSASIPIEGRDPLMEGEDLFNLIFLNFIEPRLGLEKPLILSEYPCQMSTLSRLRPGDLSVCERMELYINGVELANGFGELTDPKEQEKRFEKAKADRLRLYGEKTNEDPGFLCALEEGLPESAGMALGLDRLVAVLLGEKSVSDVLAFSYTDTFEGI